MNKTAIKNYAVDAHDQLVDQIKLKAFQYNVTENFLPELNIDSVDGKLLSSVEKSQLNALIKAVKQHGFKNVIEEVAYTWFNRFIALRYMEVNNYLPQRVRVFINENNEFKPEILSEAIHLEIDGLDKQKVFDYIEKNNTEELYKYLLLTICNDMNQYLPDMFTSFDKNDYNLLLLPDGLLKEDSVIAKLISKIDEEDWKDQENDSLSGEPSNSVPMIGWLYQYYISKRHDEVINILKGTVKKEDIPAATELFTTDWVVRYMVDNSLGRYWIERNPDSELKNKLKFLATAKDGSLPIVENDPKKPEELTFFDPCMGSGHILSYAFDVLMEIYRECGWRDKDAAISIVENNLYGLDIDERAYQLSYFAIMMKGCKYNRRFLKLDVKNNLSNIVETNELDSLSFFGMKEDDQSKTISEYLLNTFKDAVELGSLIEVKLQDYNTYEEYIENIHNYAEYSLDSIEWMDSTYYIIKKLIKQARILSRKYCITTTNPPYMSKMEGNLKKFVIKNYKDYSSDIFAVFVKRNFDFTEKNGYLGFMTPFVWMFIKSYEKLREYIINNKSISTLVQMEYSAYEEATVPICSYVLKNAKTDDLGYYFRLSDFKGGMEVQKQKVLEAINDKDCRYYYETSSENFSKIPGSPIAYWVSPIILGLFNLPKLGKKYPIKVGLQTGNNDKFLRAWFEVDRNDSKWVPHVKGGSFRKWYGNYEYFINWLNNGDLIRKNSSAVIRSEHYYFKKGITWSHTTSGGFSGRFLDGKCILNVESPSLLTDVNIYELMAYMNSKIASHLYAIIDDTMHYKVGTLNVVPYSDKFIGDIDISHLSNENTRLSRSDWDSYETSWDFTVHPLVKNHVNSISEAYNLWKEECNTRFKQLKSNEEELNRIFIDIYGLQDELTPEESDKDVTVHYVVDNKEDIPESFSGSNYVRTKQDEVKSFISYAIGCMFGRYSLDTEGLAYAGGEWDSSKYKTFIPDKDDIIPICDEDYFEDDIVSRFVEFVRVVYGADNLETNLKFISDALGGKGNPREVLRNYFLNNFYKDHCNTYQVTGSGKRPIYWLFDSGKKNGFKALVYIHRYTPDLIARMRTGYIHPLQSQYRTQIEMLNNQIDEVGSTSEKVKLQKQLKKVTEQSQELGKYEEIVHHWADKMEPMDLDDGVKVNYAKFQELLAKIK